MALAKHTDDYYYDIVRKNIKKYRQQKGFTQQSLADACDLSMTYIAEIESLKKNKSFSLATLGRIADSLQIDIKNFFEEDTK
ncbi:MAG: helix-turn-helix transcriptional regulator [Bacilli bacterium]